MYHYFHSIWLKLIYFSIIMSKKGSAKILAKKKFENEKSKNKEKQRNTQEINKNNKIHRKLILILFLFSFVQLLGMLQRIFTPKISILGALISDLEPKI